MTTRSNDIRKRAEARRLRLLTVVATPLFSAGALFLMSASATRAAGGADEGLAALAGPRLKLPAARSTDAGTPIVVAKRSRLLSNGTRARSSDSSDGKPDDSESQARSGPVRDVPLPVTPASQPQAATAPERPAPQTAPASGQLVPSNAVTAVTGQGRPSSGTECVANCGGPRGAAGSPQTTVYAGKQASDAKPVTCVAGCRGLPTPMAERRANGTSTSTAPGLEASSGTAGNRVTILRGATRTKVYSTGQ